MNQEQLKLKNAKKEYKALRLTKEKFNSSLNIILTAFSNSKLPNWGSFKFNGQFVN